MKDSFFKPISDPKIIHFFITQSEKHTSAKFVRFKSLYKVYILGSPAAVVSEVPWGHWVFEHRVCSSISSLKKNATRDNEKQLFVSVSIATCPCLSFPADWQRCLSVHSFVSVCLISVNQSVCLLISSSVSDFVAGEYTIEKWNKKKKKNSHRLTDIPDQSYMKINHFLDLATADCSSRRSWQLIASRLPLVQPPSTESWLVQEQESVVWLSDCVRQSSGNQSIVSTSTATQMSGFLVQHSLPSASVEYCV